VTAPLLHIRSSVRGDGPCSPETLYPRHSLRSHGARRDTRKTQKTCNLTAKTAPCFAPSRKPAPSLPPLQSGSSLKTPSGCFINAQPSTGQFLNARPWLVPGRYPDSASLLQPSLAQQRLHPLLPGRYV
jgi:hypothetical protein